MNPATLKRIVENHIATLEGNAFQDFCDRLCIKLYPGDYTPVRAGGRKGDMKNDGYCPKARIFFAAHATRGEEIAKTKEKIKSDLEGCLENHPDVATWIYLTNDTLLGEVETHVDDLRTDHPEVTIETWGHKQITEKLCGFSEAAIGDIAGIAIEPTVEITSEIDHAASLLRESKGYEVRAMLERLWSQHNDKMSPRQRFRVQANIGHSYQAAGEWQEAARYFLKAKQHEPTYEKARVFEALAHLLLGNKAKAEELSAAVLADFPEETLAVAVRIRSTSDEISLNEIEETVSKHELSDAEVALALAEAATVRGLPEKAELYAAKAYDCASDSAVVKEALADVMVTRARVQDRFVQQRTATKEEIDCLQKACNLYSEAMNALNVHDHAKRLSQLRLKRSTVFLALDKEEEFEKDCTVAYELDPSSVEAVFKYSGIRDKRGDRDGAIDLVNGLVDKGLRPAVDMRLAQLLWERGNPDDRARARELLLGRLDDLRQESPEVCLEYLLLLSEVELGIHGAEASLLLLDKVAEELLGSELALFLKAELLRQVGKLEEASEMTRELQALVTEASRPDTVRRTATLLQSLGLHKEALCLWKRIVEFDYIGRDTFRALECARRCEDVEYIFGLSSGLRANGLWDEHIFELELTYRAQYNDTATEIQILQGFIKEPLDPSYLPQARLRLSVAGIRTGRTELLETDPSKLPRVTEVPPSVGQHVVEVLRRGPDSVLAAVYAYDMVRLNWDDPCAHSAMVRVFLPEGPVPSIQEPEFVVPGAAVFYKEDDTGREHWHILEDSSQGKPHSILHEYGLGDALSQRMLGKKAGDNFYLVKDEIQERTATIKEVMSKYKYRFNVSFRELGTRFSHTGVVREVVVERGEGQFDFSALERMAMRRAQSVQRLNEIYRANLCPLYIFASAGGRSMVESMQYVIAETDLPLRCCLGSDEEQDEAEHALQDTEAIVVDSSALVTLLLTDSYASIAESPFKLMITEGVINDLGNAAILQSDPHSLAGSFSVDGFVPTSPEAVLKARGALQDLIDLIRSNFVIQSGAPIVTLDSHRRGRLLQIFGQAGLESVLVAAQPGRILWTDDLATAVFARDEFGCRRIWSQFLFEYFAQRAVIRPEAATDLTARLFAMRYYYVRPSVPVIMHALELAGAEADSPPLREVLDWFADTRAKREGQFVIGAGALKCIWQSNHVESSVQRITIRILERLSQRPGGVDMIKGLLGSIDRIFGVDVINAQRARNVIVGWLKSGGTRVIIP